MTDPLKDFVNVPVKVYRPFKASPSCTHILQGKAADRLNAYKDTLGVVKDYYPGRTVLGLDEQIIGYNSAIEGQPIETKYGVVKKDVMDNILNDRSRGYSMGAQRGKVIDANDPEKRGRVKVRIN